MTPVLARLDVHVTPGRRVDFYVAPVLGYVDVGEVTTRREIDWPFGLDTRETRSRPDDQLVYGLSLGLDPIGDFDPLIAHVGYGVRF